MATTITTTATTSGFLALKYPSVFVGRKPLNVYVEAAQRELNKNAMMGVQIEARGNFIPRAILVAFRLLKRVLSTATAVGPLYSGFILQPIISSVQMKGDDGKEREVPTISILVYRPPSNFSSITIPADGRVVEVPYFLSPHYPGVTEPSYTSDPLPSQPVTGN